MPSTRIARISELSTGLLAKAWISVALSTAATIATAIRNSTIRIR